MIVLGLTGSIGMGKSATARLFAEAGAAVHDADAAVHALYGPGGDAVEPVRALFPAAVVAGEVDRRILARLVAADPAALMRLEAAVHPLVSAHRDDFLKAARAEGRELAVLDIPLLFETGLEAAVDGVVVASAPEEVQRERVMARPGMTAEKLALILSRQTPDAEKRRRADFVVDTSRGLDHARAQVEAIRAAVLAAGWRRRSSALDA